VRYLYTSMIQKMQETNESTFQKKKFYNNFFLSKPEKELFFTLKELHKLNNKLGNCEEHYSKFIQDMNFYYRNIIEQYNQN
jgi:hypothetical protein